MTQPPDPDRSGSGASPWWQPQDQTGQPAQSPGAAAGGSDPASTPVYGPAGSDPAAGPDATAGSPSPYASPYGAGSGTTAVNPPRAPRQPRRPSWASATVMALGAAVLGSALTAGTIGLTNGSDAGTSTTGSSFSTSSGASSPAAAPVTGNPASAIDWEAVASAVSPSVVAVQLQNAEGSGVILDTEGHILTNNHVAADAGNGGIQVVLDDGRIYGASIVGLDPSTDLAVIKIDKPPSDLTPAVLGDSATAKVGDAVMAVGNPLGLAGTVTTGIISATDRPVTTTASQSQQNQNPFGQPGPATGETVVTNALQTDAAINPGNSGGALVDSSGRVLGITSSIASLGGGSSTSGSIGLGFAIPIDMAKNVAQQLISSGNVDHSWLGVTLQDKTVTVDGAQRNAAGIVSVTSGTPADKAGLKQGDAVIKIDGTYVNGTESFVAQVRDRAPGDKVTLTVVRGGSTTQLTATLGSKPTTSQ